MKLGRRASAALHPARLVRSSGLPVFAVSEQAARLTHEELRRSPRSSHYRAVRLKHSAAGIPELPIRRRHSAFSALLSSRSTPSLQVAKSPFSACTPPSSPPVLRTGSNTNAHAGYGVGLCTPRGCHATEPNAEFELSAVTMVPSPAFRSRRRSSIVHACGRWASWPNPSIEGTSTSGLRPLAAAPHVKRWAS